MHAQVSIQKILASFCAIALITGASVTMPASAATTMNAVAPTGMASTTFKVPGMTCADKACNAAIYMALHRLHGVKKIQIRDRALTVTVQYDQKAVKVPTLLNVFRQVGYPASIVQP
ncbi:cation transporter [Acidithiobacillus ferriphilus]|uniref:heavy-metal-associated domain-containing protein n=1 Tax=Acidithiobacillus ferriphilus TaxID=1689834 RepID=UPI001C062F9B|nr:cation transporter [Acidithiobacillus ferriphilus]MBU2784491.1 heavy-metal-associated domain-containing protein [Acidithiobacillus ferriphilus]UEP58558.1 cation transporter [Acidithiobacillus ferriphilus]